MRAENGPAAAKEEAWARTVLACRARRRGAHSAVDTLRIERRAQHLVPPAAADASVLRQGAHAMGPCGLKRSRIATWLSQSRPRP